MNALSPIDEAALFEAWAPLDGRWSPWAKPVLFAHLPRAAWHAAELPGGEPSDWTILPPADGTTALILDLPGAESVRAGLALADRGYRPVPLFNTTPGPSPVLQILPIMRALADGARDLARVSLFPDAPPAFLLDCKRLQVGVHPSPGQYDNRWIVFPQDFPSGESLGAAGVTRVLLVQQGRSKPVDDLRDVLLRFRRAGLEILSVDMAAGAAPRTLDLPPLRLWRFLRCLAMLTLGLRWNSAGGFGSIVPQPGSG